MDSTAKVDRASIYYRLRLAGKITPPQVPFQQVERTELCEEFRLAEHAKLFLLRAPAGFGKTTTMLQFRSQLGMSGIATAWVTLDSGDNDLTRFLSCLNAAFETIDSARSDSKGKQIVRGDDIGDYAIKTIERISSYQGSFAIFLDELELIHSQAVFDFIAELVASFPFGAKLVLGSRAFPLFPLGRWRAKGILKEMDAAHLRFTLEETRQFVEKRPGLALPSDDIRNLHRRTEGWAAALWLAVLALGRKEYPSQFIAGFSGTTVEISDYLAEDVLSNLPDAARRFLLRTSILDQLTPSLCDAVTGQADSSSMLDYLRHNHLFLAPLDATGERYRYHSLFADFLRGQLYRSFHGEVNSLHSIAAHWYAKEGHHVQAIEHALQGGQASFALTLLEQHAQPLLEQGRVRLLTRWFDELPQREVEKRPNLLMIYIWAISFTRGAREALDKLTTAEKIHPSEEPVVSQALALRPMLLFTLDEFESAYTLGLENLKGLPTSRPFSDAFLINSMANISAVMGKYQLARDLLDSARRSHCTDINSMRVGYLESVEGFIDLVQGRIQQASARFRVASKLSQGSDISRSNGNALAGSLMAVTLYEMNQVDDAERLLNIYLPIIKGLRLTDLLVTAHILLARIAARRNDFDQVWQRLSELEEVGREWQSPFVVANSLLERARVHLLNHNAEKSWHNVLRAESSLDWKRISSLQFLSTDIENLEVSKWRWQIHFGDPKSTLSEIEQALLAAQHAGLYRRALKFRILLSLAYFQLKQNTSAVTHAEGALRLAVTERFTTIFSDEGILQYRLLKLLGQDRDTKLNIEPASTTLLPITITNVLRAFGQIDSEKSESSSRDVQKDQAVKQEQAILTPKEIHVIELLSHGHSTAMIAEKMLVSENTIRVHLRNSYSKLNVHTRIQAIAAARRLGLIN